MLRFGDTHTAPLSRVFCYALTTESAYMDRSVWLMRSLFLDLGGKDKVNFIEILVKAMESVRNVGRNERKRFRRETILINASCALISIVNSVKSLGRDAKTQPLTIAKLILPAARILLEEDQGQPPELVVFPLKPFDQAPRYLLQRQLCHHPRTVFDPHVNEHVR